MKFVNFNEHIGFQNLHRQMGSKPTEFKVVEWQTMDEEEILKRLNSQEGIEVDFDDIKVCDDGTFEYKGKKVLVYIRDQYYDINNSGEYKFHVSNCQTITSQTQKNYGNRYVVSTRTDGNFLVNVVDRIQNKVVQSNVIKEMKVCKNCLKNISYKGYTNHITDYIIYRNFRLSEFFKLYPSTSVNPLPVYNQDNALLNIYTKDWNEISKYHRNMKNWTCESCKTKFHYQKDMLDVHHIDGIKSNNNPNNLKVLCKNCHSKLHFAV